MATMIEARPFIQGFCLEQACAKSFPIFHGDNLHLIISGIGKACCSAATAHLINSAGCDVLFNLGAAGDLNGRFRIGDIVHVNRVIEPDRPYISGKMREYMLEQIKGFDTAVLATQDKAVVSVEARRDIGFNADIADMEGAAFIQVCALYAKQGYIFKIITDTPEIDTDREIVKSVKDTAPALYEFFRNNIV